jgi:hypothetical protein
MARFLRTRRAHTYRAHLNAVMRAREFVSAGIRREEPGARSLAVGPSLSPWGGQRISDCPHVKGPVGVERDVHEHYHGRRDRTADGRP